MLSVCNVTTCYFILSHHSLIYMQKNLTFFEFFNLRTFNIVRRSSSTARAMEMIEKEPLVRNYIEGLYYMEAENKAVTDHPRKEIFIDVCYSVIQYLYSLTYNYNDIFYDNTEDDWITFYAHLKEDDGKVNTVYTMAVKYEPIYYDTYDCVIKEGNDTLYTLLNPTIYKGDLMTAVRAFEKDHYISRSEAMQAEMDHNWHDAAIKDGDEDEDDVLDKDGNIVPKPFRYAVGQTFSHNNKPDDTIVITKAFYDLHNRRTYSVEERTVTDKGIATCYGMLNQGYIDKSYTLSTHMFNIGDEFTREGTDLYMCITDRYIHSEYNTPYYKVKERDSLCGGMHEADVPEIFITLACTFVKNENDANVSKD